LNPLSPDNVELVSLSTATVAPPDVANDLIDAHRIGEAAYQAFRQEQLEANSATIQFHDKMTKNKLKSENVLRHQTETTEPRTIQASSSEG